MKTTHQCPVLGCHEQRPAEILMCASHWALVPPAIKARVWQTWKSGGVRAYLEARNEAIKAVNEKVKI